MLVQGSLGLAPWNTLASGLVEITGISFGMMTNLIEFSPKPNFNRKR